MTFAKDLSTGNAAEDRILEKLQAAFPLAYRMLGMHPDFDIWIPELGKSVEVKLDLMSQKTGNIVVEYYHNKASALTVSKADYWVFDTGEELLWFSREGILDCILSEGMEPVRIAGPSDRFAKWAFLIPLRILQRYSVSERAVQP